MENRPAAGQAVNILVTMDQNYIPHLNVMLTSLLDSDPACNFQIYLLHSSLEEGMLARTRTLLGSQGQLHLIRVGEEGLENAPTTARYPKEIYYRIFAAQYLPAHLDRILYLDPDIIINRSILPLYHLDLGDHFFAAASHIGPFLQKFNEVRLDMEEESLYINSGVMLMNLELLRKEQDPQAVFDFIRKYDRALLLPDQDIISSLYGTRICGLDAFLYNMTERLFAQHSLFERRLDLDWVRNNAVIIHYCGRNKPWKANYRGQLDVFYREAKASMAKRLPDEREG